MKIGKHLIALYLIVLTIGCSQSNIPIGNGDNESEAFNPILRLYFTSDTVEVGQQALLVWESDGNQVVVDNGIGEQPPYGNIYQNWVFPGIYTYNAIATITSSGSQTAKSTSIVVTESKDPDDPHTGTPTIIEVDFTTIVRTDKGPDEERKEKVAYFLIETSGYYQAETTTWFNSGDIQLNESFFLELSTTRGMEYSPEDANAGKYFVVSDQPGVDTPKDTYAGTYYLEEGMYFVTVSHYSRISNMYPALLNGPIDGPESVRVLGIKLTEKE